MASSFNDLRYLHLISNHCWPQWCCLLPAACCAAVTWMMQARSQTIKWCQVCEESNGVRLLVELVVLVVVLVIVLVVVLVVLVVVLIVVLVVVQGVTSTNLLGGHLVGLTSQLTPKILGVSILSTCIHTHSSHSSHSPHLISPHHSPLFSHLLVHVQITALLSFSYLFLFLC